MTSIAQYTQNQQSLINEFKAKEISNIPPKEKAATTVLIKSIVKKKDTQLLEQLLPKFVEYYDINKSKSDKTSFESKFLKSLKTDDDKKFFEDLYNKDIKGNEDSITKRGQNTKTADDMYNELRGKYPVNIPKTYTEEYDMFQPPIKPKKPKFQPNMPSAPYDYSPSAPYDYSPSAPQFEPNFPSVNKPRQGQGDMIEKPITKPKKPSTDKPKTNQDLFNQLDTKSISSIFNTGSQLYEKNKTMVDKVGKSIINNDGSWFTAIASLSQPEIEILQQLTNQTPLAFNEKDNKLLQSLIHNNKGEYYMDNSEYEFSDVVKMYGKVLFNPDAVGKVIQGTITEGANSLANWGKKLVGIKPDDPNAESDRNIKEIVAGRIDKTKQITDKQDVIDIAKGKTPSTKQPDLSNKPKASDFLTPPDVAKYGYKERTAFQDVAAWFQKTFAGMNQFDDGSKEYYLNYLKKSNRPLYEKYQREMVEYEKRKNKVLLNADSSYANAVGSKALNDIITTMDNMLRTPGGLSDLSEEQVADIYDGINYLKQVREGKNVGVNYQTLQDISQSIFDEMPLTLVEKFKPKLDNINAIIKSDMMSQFAGDSDLMTEFKFDNNAKPIIREETKTEAKTEIDTKPKVDTKTEYDDKEPEDPEEREKKDDAESTAVKEDITERSVSTNKRAGDFRPRLSWGGTDVLIATKEETNLMNAVADSMSLDEIGWGNGAENTLFNINNIDNEKRYSRTLPMPYPPKREPKGLPYNFSQSQRPQFNPQLAPLGSILVDRMRDNLDFGQYQKFAERCNLSTTDMARFIQSDPNSFPAQIDMRTGGENMKFSSNYNYVMNERFLIKR